MHESYKPIINHISSFLDYCQQINLSDNTQKNYKRYLNKFIFWLEKKNKKNLLPHELTINDIQDYKIYLSQSKDEKDRTLKTISQNYYLIALRALLNYFLDKDITSFLPGKVKLPKNTERKKTIKLLNLEQIEKLLKSPDTKTSAGLRDKAILEVLISTGLKVNQLKSLNRNQIKQFILPGEALPWVNKYLDARDDKNEALFLNNRSREGVDRRLTARSIERRVNYYGRKINLPFLITPEILRWSRALALLNKETKIKKLYAHKSFMITNYKASESKLPFPYPKHKEVRDNLFFSWSVVEKSIETEVEWLKNNIQTLPDRYKQDPPFLKCDDCILRKIAILITSGEAKTTKFKANQDKDLWNDLTKKININKISRHGREWHKKMMNVIFEYFKLQNYKVVLEPILNCGRADLGAYRNTNNIIYIEVGTVSLFKLWYNLSTMKNATFLVVPEEDYTIEFKT